jgi:glycosyltransferase involved in cell wall biosynthesis
VHVIPHGLQLDGHGERWEKGADEPRVVGFLARICPDKGLHLLVEACERLAERRDLPAFELRAAGYLGDGDRDYLRQVESRAAKGQLAGRFKYLGELDRRQKIEFLQSLDVMSVPTVYQESKGIPALEAMANAVPVVLPNHGSFPEMILDTGGGVLFRPHDSADLAEKLAELLRDRLRARQLGISGQRAIHDRYHAAAMARQTVDVYRRLVAAPC